MARPGPRPKPTALRLLHGDRRDRINLDEPKPPKPAKPPRAPSHLSDGAKAAWRELARKLHRVGVLTELDLLALEVLCVAVDDFRRASELSQAALIIEGSRHNLVRNPAGRVQRDAASIIARFAGEFGLTPSSRSGIRLEAGDDDEADRRLGEILGGG
jgi:P27 family predicted phage terminase small subunit